MKIKRIEEEVNKLIKEAQNFTKSDTFEKDTLLTQAYKQVEIVLKLNRLLDEKLFELTVINEIGNIIRSVEDYEEVMRSILTILKTIIPYDIGGIILQENSKLDSYINIKGKISQQELTECKNKLFANTNLSELNNPEAKNKEIIIGQNNILKNIEQKNRNLSFWAVPLEIRLKIIGSIFIANIDNEINEHSKYILNMVANQVVLVINNCQLYHRMKDMAIHDGLTGLYNHRYFQLALEKEISRASRHKGSLFIMLLDIDYFKDYNDRFGHQMGDVLLQEISKLLMKNVREVDLVARYGGEEFAIILPHTDKKGALQVAERIRQTIEEYPFRGKDDKEIICKTVSIGLASYNKKNSKVDLINYADNALYQAKHSGRNMVKIEED